MQLRILSRASTHTSIASQRYSKHLQLLRVLPRFRPARKASSAFHRAGSLLTKLLAILLQDRSRRRHGSERRERQSVRLDAEVTEAQLRLRPPIRRSARFPSQRAVRRNLLISVCSNTELHNAAVYPPCHNSNSSAGLYSSG